MPYTCTCEACGLVFTDPHVRRFCSYACFHSTRIKPVKQCLICGVEFVGRNSKSRFCSRACAYKNPEPRKPDAWDSAPCAQCGKEIHFYKCQPKKFCSPGCLDAYNAERWTESECPHCNTSFRYLASWPRKYCSNECAGAANISNIKKWRASSFLTNCEYCTKEYSTTPAGNRGRFCSLKCWGKWVSLNRCGKQHHSFGRKFGRVTKALLILKSCEVCKRPFQTKESHVRKRRTCSRACYGVIQSTKTGEQHHSWKGGYAGYYGPNWRAMQRLVRDRDKVCVNCGMTPEQNGKALDVHHKIPFRIFGVARHSEANHPENLVACCRGCHKILERQSRIAIGEIQEAEQRPAFDVVIYQSRMEF